MYLKVPIVISPSILSADFACLGQQCNRMLEAGADQLHVDIMDGHFVNNLTIGPPVIKSLVKKLPKNTYLDCHLMVTNPQEYIDNLAVLGVSNITFHYQLENINIVEICKKIKSKDISVGISLKPGTQLDCKLKDYLSQKLIDRILVMTVNPGFGGQSFMVQTMSKVKELREQFPLLDIQVDGGIYIQNIHIAAQNGANIFVSGTGIFKAEDAKQMISSMRSQAQKSFKQK